jgi:DNA-binding response OmpR family regulator
MTGGECKMYKILLVEDDFQIREIVEDYINKKGEGIYTLVTAADGDEGMDMILENEFDLVLLDIMLPGMDGFALCREIRRDSTCPIIFLTAKSREEDKLYGYDLGCDDYITKPFSLAELYAKINALLKRSKGMVGSDSISCGRITIMPGIYKVLVDQQEIVLPPKEYVMLKCLMENKNHLVTRDTLLTRIWGYDYEGSTRVVDNHMKKLRKALGDAGNQIKTVFTKGYEMVSET